MLSTPNTLPEKRSVKKGSKLQKSILKPIKGLRTLVANTSAGSFNYLKESFYRPFLQLNLRKLCHFIHLKPEMN